MDIELPVSEEMDSGVDQLDGGDHTVPTGCEQRDAGRDEKSERQNEAREQRENERLRVKLPQRSDMICGFASLKGFSVYPLMSLWKCMTVCRIFQDFSPLRSNTCLFSKYVK